MLFNIVLAQLLLVLVCPVKVLIHAHSDWLCSILKYGNQLALHLLKNAASSSVTPWSSSLSPKSSCSINLTGFVLLKIYGRPPRTQGSGTSAPRFCTLCQTLEIGAHLTKRCLAGCYVQITQILVI